MVACERPALREGVFFRLSSLDYRFALIPIADLGHAKASFVATLGLRICRLSSKFLSFPQ